MLYKLVKLNDDVLSLSHTFKKEVGGWYSPICCGKTCCRVHTIRPTFQVVFHYHFCNFQKLQFHHDLSCG